MKLLLAKRHHSAAAPDLVPRVQAKVFRFVGDFPLKLGAVEIRECNRTLITPVIRRLTSFLQVNLGAAVIIIIIVIFVIVIVIIELLSLS